MHIIKLKNNHNRQLLSGKNYDEKAETLEQHFIKMNKIIRFIVPRESKSVLLIKASHGHTRISKTVRFFPRLLGFCSVTYQNPCRSMIFQYTHTYLALLKIKS